MTLSALGGFQADTLVDSVSVTVPPASNLLVEL
jgi:hypothetical protein